MQSFHQIGLTKEESARNLLKISKENKLSLGKWARSLLYHFTDPARSYNENYRHDTYLDSFATYAPFLKSINTHMPNYAFYMTLAQLLKNSSFKHLKSIPELKNYDDIRAYVSCTLACQKSLQQPH
jgi:hypothetical protein